MKELSSQELVNKVLEICDRDNLSYIPTENDEGLSRGSDKLSLLSKLIRSSKAEEEDFLNESQRLKVGQALKGMFADAMNEFNIEKLKNWEEDLFGPVHFRFQQKFSAGRVPIVLGFFVDVYNFYTAQQDVMKKDFASKLEEVSHIEEFEHKVCSLGDLLCEIGDIKVRGEGEDQVKVFRGVGDLSAEYLRKTDDMDLFLLSKEMTEDYIKLRSHKESYQDPKGLDLLESCYYHYHKSPHIIRQYAMANGKQSEENLPEPFPSGWIPSSMVLSKMRFYWKQKLGDIPPNYEDSNSPVSSGDEYSLEDTVEYGQSPRSRGSELDLSLDVPTKHGAPSNHSDVTFQTIKEMWGPLLTPGTSVAGPVGEGAGSNKDDPQRNLNMN